MRNSVPDDVSKGAGLAPAAAVVAHDQRDASLHVEGRRVRAPGAAEHGRV